jgi:hypothetical protein
VSRIDTAVRAIEREIADAQAELGAASAARGRAEKRLATAKAKERAAVEEVGRLTQAKRLLTGEQPPREQRGRPEGSVDEEKYEAVVAKVQRSGTTTVAAVHGSFHRDDRPARATIIKYLKRAEREGRVRFTGERGHRDSPLVEFVAPVVQIETRRRA